MEHLTTFDAGFLGAEDSDQRISLAIGGLAVLEGPMPDHEVLTATLEQRISTCPRFAQRLRRRPFDLGPPEWVDAIDFNLAHHVRRVALPRPGHDADLYQLVADVMSRRLDRSRPLWEIWVIEGLDNGRWAMLIKVHHCIADGIATAHMLAGLSDGGIHNSFVSRIRADANPRNAIKAPGFGANPVNWASQLWGTAAMVTTTTARAARGAAELAVGLLRPTSSSLNGPITSLRRYSAARVSLDDIRKVCQTFDVTINDVALAALAESYRAVLIRRGEQPLPESLRTLVPVSMRSGDAAENTGNQVSVMLPYLPVEEENAVRRLRLVHSRLSRTKATGQRQAGHAFVSLANRIPFALTAWALRLATRLPQRGVVTLATNVPGPREPLQIMGRKVIRVLPIPPIAMQLRTGVAMLSYANDLFFGILADFDSVPDVDEIARGIEIAVARLVAVCKRHKTARDHRGLHLVTTA
ncbi:wax ester/triacylglycerol synthase family O-acyltransferase [Mycobacterium heckeshornense]|uniref:Diacylglycerol O-acyltransferase n=1 Tax=Mycobacterium heckeshornense TaxID=110505 RepID=A0A2G8B776_9MYCO|nr:wax ester/triacylglycerol synthase family O-acyltransferase [Mycobacterium heckeshornense]KMV21073.1 diacylglycerol O-acyltransferase [Mycobacterium heckeshornense]MCV7035965.1 wax ester/triacylglycerol synthase family O-acyltransferase [Mycobacterium heckeshornense]PIJ33584.1 wax ester/triacylglycerol synthase family O-acyltransferase [Mycobacterium heckeshornense]BCO36667.1 putative diacyglycerol O-acyltransferase [Mycobacterium heckeshornense]